LLLIISRIGNYRAPVTNEKAGFWWLVGNLLDQLYILPISMAILSSNL